MKSQENIKDPRRCADITHWSLFGTGITPICKHFWWDCGPIDEMADKVKYYKEICCTISGKIERIGMGVVNHTAKCGCCCWKPEFVEESQH